MDIHGYTADGTIDATIEGKRLTVPDDMANRHRRMIAEWEADGNTIPPYVPPAPTAADVRGEAARVMKKLAGDYLDAERETWPTQVAEARAVLADPEALTPMLGPLAAARGLTVAEMAERVLGLSDALAAATGRVLAAQARLLSMNPIPTDYTDDKHWH